MRTAFVLAAVTALIPAAQAFAGAKAGSLFFPGRDAHICDPIFSKLEDTEQRQTLMAQATPPKQPESSPAEKPADIDEDELATQLKDMLQACSYDGKALAVDAKALSAAPGTDGIQAVNMVMRYTGLPQNFRIMEADVPNAAAIIVLGPDGVPQRVIAYNKGFMQQVAKATDNNDWSSLSIMAHEIGHHLSGHTLVPGGSQPPIELEADKFSGYVLFKMGAKLGDAQKAIATLIPEAASPTHPGRTMRLYAIQAGWMQSCQQQQNGCGETTVAAVQPKPATDETQAEQQKTARTLEQAPPAAAPMTPPVSTELQIAANGVPRASMPKIPGAAEIVIPSIGKDGGSNRPAPVPAALDRIPQLDQTTTPSKFDRFVYDAVGVFDTETKEKLSTLAYQYAAATDVEIVTIVTNDLQGRSADQYALDVMRQMRVGKMDVGNGAVLVVAPEAKQTGAALGPGLLVQYDTVEPLRSYLKSFLTLNDTPRKSLTSGRLIADASYRVMRDTQALEWQIKFNSLQQMLTTAEKARADLQQTNTPYNPNTDPTWRKLLRIDATVVSTKPDMANPALDINEPKTRHVGPALHVRTADGKDAVLYVNQTVPTLMPVPLEDGKRYAFTARDSFLAADAPQFDLISYDQLD
ncbi:TPM domain-containing protein [Endobacterium cereale]|nr:TPM domain-containing protein [Endobacterium cereale]MEB2846265.1 TPM domain-containing protein [Endobacterium cereale]